MQPKKEHYRGKLPHYQQPGQCFSVTIVLRGAMPKGAMAKYAVKLEAARNPLKFAGIGVSNSDNKDHEKSVKKISDFGKSESWEPEFPNSDKKESGFSKFRNFDLGKSKSQLTQARKDYYIALQKYRLAYDKILNKLKEPKIDLTNETNRKVIQEALIFWEGKKLKNHAWCIMSNHIHWIFTVFERELGESEFPNSDDSAASFFDLESLSHGGVEISDPDSSYQRLGKSQSRELDFPKSNNKKPIYLQDILHSVKLFSARRINKNENQNGQLWEHESFDTTIRNEKHFMATVKYVIQNPVSANLATNWRDWPATFLEPELASLF